MAKSVGLHRSASKRPLSRMILSSHRPSLTAARSSSRRKTRFSSSMSSAVKSCQVGPPPQVKNKRLTCSLSLISFRSAACPSNRRRGAGNSSESGCETSRSARASLSQPPDSASRLICAMISLSSSKPALISMIAKSMPKPHRPQNQASKPRHLMS